MFRVLTSIVRISYNCSYSFWYWLTGSTTRSCNYSCRSSWWWMSTPEICRAAYRNIINWIQSLLLLSHLSNLQLAILLLLLVGNIKLTMLLLLLFVSNTQLAILLLLLLLSNIKLAMLLLLLLVSNNNNYCYLKVTITMTLLILYFTL